MLSTYDRSRIITSNINPRSSLSAVDLEVSKLVGLGYSNKEIANLLGYVESTIENHVYNIKRAFGATKARSLAIMCYREFWE